MVELPLAQLAAGVVPAPGSVLQLSPSSLLASVRRRMGFATGSPIIAALPLPGSSPAIGGSSSGEGGSGGSSSSGGLTSLFVVHEDGAAHQWQVSTARQLSSISLTTAADGASAGGAMQHQLRPTRLLACSAADVQGEMRLRGGGSAAASAAGPPPWDVLLVWEMSAPDTISSSDVRVMPCRLEGAAATNDATTTAAASACTRLVPAMATPVRLQLEQADASLLDARSDGAQLLLLCTTRSGSQFVVAYSSSSSSSSSRGDWGYQGRAALLQQRASSDWGINEVQLHSECAHASRLVSHTPNRRCTCGLRLAAAGLGTYLSPTHTLLCLIVVQAQPTSFTPC